MGTPSHYSLELPQRCLRLIDELWPQVKKIKQSGHPELGSLTATFLISMSMPIINLPVERMLRQNKGQEYADDRLIAPELTRAISTVLGKGKFQTAPFYSKNAWRFVTAEPLFNIADPLPDEIAFALDSNSAAINAGNMPTSQWCSILRNAMAHGGIAYLDANGRTTLGGRVEMYAFVSGKYEEVERKRNLFQLQILRISENNYRRFLHTWVEWLVSSRLAELVR